MFSMEEAKDDERREVLALTLLAYSKYKEYAMPWFWQTYAVNIEQAVLYDPQVIILVVKNNQHIIGSALFYSVTNGKKFASVGPEMRLLSVHPSYRNLGIAGLLIDECEKRAGVSGILTLHTTKLMLTAGAMYERRGYVRFPEIDFEPVPGFIVWGFKKKLNEKVSNYKEIKNEYSSRIGSTAINK